MKDCNCGYCMRGELLDKFGIEICDLEVSQLILFKEQSHPGRVIVAYKDHVSEIVSISDEERNLFMADVARAAKALHEENSEKYYNRVYGSLRNLVYAATICVIAIVPFIFGILIKGYKSAYLYIPILVFSVYFSNMASFYGGIFSAYKKTKII